MRGLELEYKWTVLVNTTMGVVLASIDINIFVIIALPAIFRGINLDPLSPGAFDYLLWIIFGYDVVTATLLVTFGRLADMFGRVRLYNLGFAVYTVGSILLYLVPDKGQLGALEILIFRLVQGVGGRPHILEQCSSHYRCLPIIRTRTGSRH